MIAKDKILHIVGGCVLGAIGAGLTYLQPWAAGIALAAIIGIGKEANDIYSGAGAPEILDAVATIAGGAAVSAGIFAVAYI